MGFQISIRWCSLAWTPQRSRENVRDTETGLRIKIVTAVEYPGDGSPKSVAFPAPTAPGVTEETEGIRVVTLEKLIEMNSDLEGSLLARC